MVWALGRLPLALGTEVQEISLGHLLRVSLRREFTPDKEKA